jgi:hypothetical protein
MSIRKIIFFLGGLSFTPTIINHFKLDFKRKKELFESIDDIKKGTRGLIKFSYNQIKDIIEGDSN